MIDKDFASSLLASELGADLFVITTAVEQVALDFGKPTQRWLDRMTLAEAKQYLAEGSHFAAGSMAPKIEACIWYLERGGNEAVITDPPHLREAVRGDRRDPHRPGMIGMTVIGAGRSPADGHGPAVTQPVGR